MASLFIIRRKRWPINSLYLGNWPKNEVEEPLEKLQTAVSGSTFTREEAQKNARRGGDDAEST